MDSKYDKQNRNKLKGKLRQEVKELTNEN